MSFLSIIPQYISWHYTRGFMEVILLFKNFSWFIWNFFSVKVLFKTLFYPFKRLDIKSRGFNPEAFFESLATNTLMRLLGFVLRSFFIILGIVTLIAFFLFSIIFIFVWTILPFVLLGMFVLGFITIFKSPIS